MSDMLTRLAERTLGLFPSLQPKLASIYEPSQMFGDGLNSSSLPDSKDEPGTAFDSSKSRESNLSDIFSQTPLVPSEQTNLPITRLSHNLSETIFQTSIEQPTDLSSTVSAAGKEDVDLTSSSNNLVPSQISAAETSLNNSSELTPLDSPVLLPEESTKINTRSQPSLRSSITLPSNPINSAQNDSSNSVDPLSPSLKQISIEPVNNPQDFSLRVNSSLTQPQTAIEVQSASQNSVTQSALVNPVVTKPLTQPLVNSDRALNLTPPLSTDDRTVRATLRPLVPVTVPQSDRVVNSPSTRFQQRQEQTQSPPPPTIQVKIGRIEIRAVTNPPPPPRSRSTTSTPRLSLDDYLKSRGGG